MKQLNTIAIDLAKNVFQLCVVTPRLNVLENKKVTRNKLSSTIATKPRSIVAMEACYSSHYWARVFQSMGHEVRLIPAQHVKPFVRGNKNDHNDALAIAEAASRPNLRFVPIKPVDQQDIQAPHRIRDRLVAQRIALMNQTRGLLSEYGIIAPQGIQGFKNLITDINDSQAFITPLIKEQMSLTRGEFDGLTLRLKQLNTTLGNVAQQHPLCQILCSLPGIGPINATALYSAIGDGSQFSHPRELSVWLGLTPRQYSSGEKSTSSGITKRGNQYLRKQLIHGARAVIYRRKNRDEPVLQWVDQVVARRGVNKAAVALANRLARLAWILLQRKEFYRPVKT